MENGFVAAEEVKVSVTEVEEQVHTVSWLILWGGYLFALIACGIQNWRDRRRHDLDEEQGAPNNREGNESSSGDSTRTSFYRHLCVALFTRNALIPVELFSKSNFLQLIAETLPEMTFASSWTLLVTFFVHLVGAASGAGTFDRPGHLLQAMAYGIYLVLIVTDIWNNHASVLLYAVLCCIYAALFGTLLYFGPRLVVILQPSLSRRSGLAIRLIGCTLVCMVTFGAKCVNLARQVVDPPEQKRLWWSYGLVELLPSITLLLMMHSNRSQRTKTTNGGISAIRTDNNVRRGGNERLGETAPLSKPDESYGTPSHTS